MCSALPIHCSSHDTIYQQIKILMVRAGMDVPSQERIMLRSQKCAPASFKLHINEKRGRADAQTGRGIYSRNAYVAQLTQRG